MKSLRPQQVIIFIIAMAASIFAIGATPHTSQLAIWQIQGDGSASPYRGETVTTTGVVTAVGTEGFFVQTPDDEADNDDSTSNGIYVYVSRQPDVMAGDRVSVTGRIEENYGNTEFGDDRLELTVISTGEPLPQPVLLEGPFPPRQNQRPDAFEAYEGMLVRVEEAVATGGARRYYAGLYNEESEVPVVLGSDRPFREPGIEPPADDEPASIPRFDNNPEVFEFGFGGKADTADFASAEMPVMNGMRLSGTGPVIYRFNRYQVWPLAGTLAITPGEAMVLPRPVPAGTPGQLRVATQNVLNLFDPTFDRGVDDEDSTPTEEEFAVILEKLARQVCDVLVTPDIIALQEVENLAVLDNTDPGEPDLVGAIAEHCGAEYIGLLLEGLDGRGIDVAYLVADTIEVVELYQIGMDAEFRPTHGGLREALFERPPLVLRAIYDPEGAAFPITVIAVHNKSYNDSQQDAVREWRYEEALYLASEIQYMQEQDPDINLVVTGDFNAFAFNDGLAPSVGIISGQVRPGQRAAEAVYWPDADIVEPDLVIQTVERLPEEERYSYVHDGSAQALDHILTSQALDAHVVSVAYSRGNADSAWHFGEDPSTPMASSDHDGAVLVIDPKGGVPLSGGERPTRETSGGLGQILLGLIVAGLAAALLALSRRKKK